MPYIAKPIDRDQVMITTFDLPVEWNSIPRVIDHFVNNIDFAGMGFKNVVPPFEGRPGYPAECMVKLYLYGYRKNIRSSRKLENACSVNLEVMRLMGRLKPDFRTISDFRKNNIECMKKVYKEFVKRVTVDVQTGFVSIDGSKFRAWNSKDRNFTVTKLDNRIQWLEDHTEEYLRLMETHLMVDYKMTNRVTDHGLIESTAEGIKAETGGRTLETVADKGYEQPEDIIRCLERGSISNVILPEGQDVYELEIVYEETSV